MSYYRFKDGNQRHPAIMFWQSQKFEMTVSQFDCCCDLRQLTSQQKSSTKRRIDQRDNSVILHQKNVWDADGKDNLVELRPRTASRLTLHRSGVDGRHTLMTFYPCTLKSIVVAAIQFPFSLYNQHAANFNQVYLIHVVQFSFAVLKSYVV